MKSMRWVLAVAVMGAFLGVAPAAHAQCADLDGDGLSDTVSYSGYNATVRSGNGTVYTYTLSAWTAANKQELDGSAGCELVYFSGDRITVVTHRTRDTYVYYMGSYSSTSGVETDGIGGNELVVHSSNTTTRIICHRTRQIRSYYVPMTWVTMSPYDQDGRPGNELVYSNRLVINDALGTTYYH